jgi:transcriptional regulator with XRE-family HTH domain
MRLIRNVREISLDTVASECGIRRAWLSTIERFPHRFVSPRLRRKLSEFFGADYDTVLAKGVDNHAIAASLLQAIAKKVKS